LQSLEERSPRSRRNRLEHSECLVNLGAANLDTGHVQEAATLLNEARGRLTRLVQEDPNAVASRYWLAVAMQALGRVALVRGQMSAGRILEESIATYEHVPKESQAPGDLLLCAWSLWWIGRAELRTGHLAAIPPLHGRLDALKRNHSSVGFASLQVPRIAQIEALLEPMILFSRAENASQRIAAQRGEVKARRDLAGKQPDNRSLRFEVAWSVIELAELLARDDQLEEAKSSLDRALTVLLELGKAEPENLRWRQGLARVWEALGRVHARSGHKAKARDAAGRAVAIGEQVAQKDTAYLYDLACMLSLRSAFSSSASDSAAAIAALRRAREAGFDNDYLLRTDPRIVGF
jgi:tetratricopeptide (TPR) repeat protein